MGLKRLSFFSSKNFSKMNTNKCVLSLRRKMLNEYRDIDNVFPHLLVIDQVSVLTASQSEASADSSRPMRSQEVYMFSDLTRDRGSSVT